MKVRIKKLPQARTGYQVQGGLVNDVPAMGGRDYNSYIGAPDMKVNRSLTAVPREDANLEAEGGETVMGNIDGSNIPSFYTIQGPRHANGGVPLNLPDDSFIFSDTKSMKISDPSLLKMFGLSSKKGGYTPAEMSKKYDINKYRQILQDPESDKIARKTAEIMIKNAVMKLGALAIAQEGKKGFPQGIPEIAKPYMEANNIAEEDLVPQQEQPQQPPQRPEDQMSLGEEGVGSGQEMPMNMPNGEPVAMPEEMPEASPEQMMQPPMARYGMFLPHAQDGYQVTDAQGNAIMPIDAYMPPSVPIKPDLSNWDNMDPASKFNAIRTMTTTPQMFTPEELQLYMMNEPTDEEIMMMNQTIPTEPLQIPQQQYGGIPMADYGMTMGGFDFPYYPDEMAYGGSLPKAASGAITPYEKAKTKQGNVTPTGKQNKFSDRKQKLDEYLGQWEGTIPGIKNMTEGQAQKAIYEWSLKNNPDAIRNMWKEFGLTAKGMKSKKIKGLSEKGTGQFTEEMLKDPKLLEQLQEAYVDNLFGVRQLDPKVAEKPKTEITTTTPTTKKKCECTDEEGNTTTFEIEKDEECVCGEDEVVTDEQFAGPPVPRNPKWWLQDTINTAGAFGDLMRTKKYMPWEARVDLEEPRPTFLDPTRELAAQSEQANIAAQASAQFAGPQALAARLAAIQGQGAASAANTLSNINNQNVNIANQFEANQVGVRNQEQAMNQQMANRLFDKNTIANQQFDNALKAGRANLREAYNTALTNRAKTDALNQMYPNYQVDPTTGGLVAYTPTDKTVDPGEDEMTAREYADSLSGYTPEMQKLLFQQKFGKRYGGQMFEHGGYVYTTFPMILL